MISYTSERQLSLDFDTGFSHKLDAENRWVEMADIMPWEKLIEEYIKNFKSRTGRPTIEPRMVIGAMVVKHYFKLSDRQTVIMIKENIYVQYFCCNTGFSSKDPFDASLLVDVRKRMGTELFKTFYNSLAAQAEAYTAKKKSGKKNKKKDQPKDTTTDKAATDNDNCPPSPTQDVESQVAQVVEPDESAKPNKGTLKIDATVADADILYPTDIGLLNTCRENAERIIDQLYTILKQEAATIVKPRDYRRIARKAYLKVAKKKRRSIKEIKKTIKFQLQYVARDIRIIKSLLDKHERDVAVMSKRDYLIWLTMQHIYTQQLEMYNEKESSLIHRIVKIFQP